MDNTKIRSTQGRNRHFDKTPLFLCFSVYVTFTYRFNEELSVTDIAVSPIVGIVLELPVLKHQY